MFPRLESCNVGLAHPQHPRELRLREPVLRAIGSNTHGYLVSETSSVRLRPVLWIVEVTGVQALCCREITHLSFAQLILARAGLRVRSHSHDHEDCRRSGAEEIHSPMSWCPTPTNIPRAVWPGNSVAIGTKRHSFAYEAAGGGVFLSSIPRLNVALGAASACPLSMA